MTASTLAPPYVEDASDEAPAPSFVVELSEYSGPLDLLLSLIRDEQVDIADIPIARIAEQFLARIRSLGLNEAADYLEMAARLLRIKAQMLLPRREGDEDWEDPRAELVRRLLEYQQMREVAHLLEKRADERNTRHSRAFMPAPPPLPASRLSTSLIDLLGAVDRVLRHAVRPQLHDVIARPLDVDGAMTIVRSVLTLRASVRWFELLAHGRERWQILSMLLALLELARSGELRVAQTQPFSDMEITRDAAGEAA